MSDYARLNNVRVKTVACLLDQDDMTPVYTELGKLLLSDPDVFTISEHLGFKMATITVALRGIKP